jgi:hypothetical protein
MHFGSIAGHGRIWPGDGLGLTAATRTIGGRRARTLGGGARMRGMRGCADARIGMVMFFSISWDKKRKKNDRKMVI